MTRAEMAAEIARLTKLTQRQRASLNRLRDAMTVRVAPRFNLKTPYAATLPAGLWLE